MSTGRILEKMILHALDQGKYMHKEQAIIGLRPGSGAHKVDLVATNQHNETFLISLKWQQTSGTAEQKVPYEVICLKDMMANNHDKYKHAYLVLGGNGWTLRSFYVDGLNQYLPHRGDVTILGLEDFIARANSGQL